MRYPVRTKDQRCSAGSRVPATVALCLLGILACSPSPEPPDRAQDAPPDAATILDQAIKAMGGDAALEGLNNRVMKGSLTLPAMGLEGSYATYFATGGRMSSVVEFPMIGKNERGTDGKVAWEIDPMQGPRIILGLEKARLMRDADFLANLHWRKHYREAEYTGSEMLAGQDCHKIVLTPNSGTPVTEYYAKDSGLLAGNESDFISPSVSGREKTLLRDYREVDGVKLPYEIISTIGGQEFVFRIDSIQHNADLPEDCFDLPDSIAALLK